MRDDQLTQAPGGRWRAVIFDLDGTLIHSAPDLHVAGNLLLREEGQPEVSLAAVERMVGEGVPKLVERLFATADIALSGPALDAYAQRFRELYLQNPAALTTLYPGAMELLERLRAAGVPMGLCTNKPEEPTAAILRELRIERFFQAVVGGDTLPVRKPDPAPLLHTANALRAQAEAVLFVGDSATDAATGLAAGIATALVAGGYTSVPIAQLPGIAHLESIAEVAALVLDGAAALASDRATD